MAKYSNGGLTPAIEALYLDDDTADVQFIFKSTIVRFDTVPAHKSILMASSNVFREMFSGQWKGKDCVQVANVSSVAFKEFLQFFYISEVSMSMETVASVMDLGQKYRVADCISTCIRFLADNLTNDNVCWVLALAVKYNHDELAKLCEVTIGINTSAVLKSSNFIKIDRHILARILKLDSLTCLESELFTAAMLWVKALAKQDYLNCDIISTYLGESFHDVRFELMPMNDFIEIFSSYETLFTNEKRRNIIQQIASKEFQTETDVSFDRDCAWYKLPIITCEREWNYTTKKPYSINYMEMETFSTNKPLLLRGFVCAEIRNLDDSFTPITDDICAQIKILEFRGTIKGPQFGLAIVYEDNDTELEYDDEDDEYHVWLTKPVIIKPGKKYQIRLQLDLEDELCTNVKMKGIQASSNGFVVTFHTEQDRGLITGLKFNRF